MGKERSRKKVAVRQLCDMDTFALWDPELKMAVGPPTSV